MFPTQYHGETQEEEYEFTNDDGYEIEKETTMSESINRVNDRPFQYAPVGMGEYFCALGDGDSDDAILTWQNTLPVHMISTTPIHSSDRYEPVHIIQRESRSNTIVRDEFAEQWESPMFESNQPTKNYLVKDVCKDMDLSDDNTPRNIKVYEKITDDKWKFWR